VLRGACAADVVVLQQHEMHVMTALMTALMTTLMTTLMTARGVCPL
jgi:hypothetical protein